MTKTRTQTLLPSLRFPEFETHGPWTQMLGGELFDQVSNKEHDSNLPILAITQEHGAIPREQIEYHVSVSEKSIENYKVVEPGDFIISLRSFQGGIEYSDFLGLCSPAYVILRLRGDEVYGYFKNLFKTKRFINELSREIEGIRDGKIVSYKQFSALRVPVPPTLDEQRRIAEFLSSIDALIDAEGKKLEALKSHKNGLMQQLFPAEGETLPKLRLPEFQDAEEWVEKTLGSLGAIVTGNTPSTTKPENYGGEWPFVSPADLSGHRYVDRTKKTLSDIGMKASRPIKANSIMFVCIGSTIGKVAQNRYESATNQQINSLTPKAGYSSSFVYFALEVCAERISRLAGRQAVPIVNKTIFSSVLIKVPSFLEQEKIAACLSAIDDLTFAQSIKVDMLKLHKKGLLQQLFPALVEVQG